MTWKEDGRDGTGNFMFVGRNSTDTLTGVVATHHLAVTLRNANDPFWSITTDRLPAPSPCDRCYSSAAEPPPAPPGKQ